MSLRPAVRREGPLEQSLLMALLVVLGATFMLWLTGQVAGFVTRPVAQGVAARDGQGGHQGAAPPLRPGRRLAQGRPPAPARPVLFWATFMILLVVLGAAWVYLSAALRAARRRMGRPSVVERAAPAADQVGPAGWARPQLFRELYVRAPTPWRVTLGRVNGRLVAGEPLQSVIALGPTQSQKTSGLASRPSWSGTGRCWPPASSPT
jgi:hypothetical protein